MSHLHDDGAWEQGTPITDDMHAVGFVAVRFETRILRRNDGLIAGARIISTSGPKLMADILLWLNRETDEFEELRPYRVGMLRRPR